MTITSKYSPGDHRRFTEKKTSSNRHVGPVYPTGTVLVFSNDRNRHSLPTDGKTPVIVASGNDGATMKPGSSPGSLTKSFSSYNVSRASDHRIASDQEIITLVDKLTPAAYAVLNKELPDLMAGLMAGTEVGPVVV